MRIAFDAKRLFWNFTGLGNYSRTLVTNLLTYYPEQTFHLFSPRIQDHPRTAPFLQHPALSIHTASKGNKNYWRTFRIKKDLQQQKIDLYHGLSHEIPVGIAKTRIKSVVTIHDLIFKRYPHLFPFLDRKIYDWKFRYACQQADLVLAISESTKQDIHEFYQIPMEKIKVLYQTCHSIFQQAWPTEAEDRAILQRYQLPEQYLLYVGSIIERKNLLPLVQALARQAPDQQIPLVILGQGKSYWKQVQAFIAQQGLEKRVFVPSPSFTDFPALYRQAQVMVYPSTYEGFGLPIVESLFSGTPVITTSASSLPEAGGPGAHYLEQPSPEQILIGIEKVLGDSNFAQQLAREGREHVQQFQPQLLTEQLMAIYQQV